MFTIYICRSTGGFRRFPALSGHGCDRPHHSAFRIEQEFEQGDFRARDVQSGLDYRAPDFELPCALRARETCQQA